ncbi:MAG: hypothetical protein GY953_41460, partial [bacterium]|nr:hypothetical protein [bacterium]
TVCLTGDGGDELFAGYERFVAARLAETYRRAPHLLRRKLPGLLKALPESTGYYGFVKRARRFVEHAALPLDRRYLAWASVFQKEWLSGALLPGEASQPERHILDEFQQVRGLDPVSQLLYVHFKTCLPGDLLAKTDRTSMAASLEARSPLLDHRLLEFAWSIPTEQKLRGLTTKHILKEALRGIVPDRILHRKKHGFSVPVGHWFRNGLKDYIRSTVVDSLAGRGPYFRPEALRRLVDEHQAGERDHGLQLWTLLTFEVWHRVFFENGYRPSVDAPALSVRYSPSMTARAGVAT